MEEFYAECDDYLVEIRRGLLKLDEQVGQISLDGESLEKIFRSFHSLKGICGMAGLQEAEQLAHRAEDYLRALTRQETILTEAGLNVLAEVTKTLEELVLGHRQGQPAAQIGPLLERIAGLAAGGPGGSPEGVPENATDYSEQLVGRLRAARQQGKKLFRLLFRPSPELDQRGVKLSSVRSQLQAVGEILHAAPKVQSGGELLFEFVIAAQSESHEVNRLATIGGVEVTPLDTAEARTSAAAETSNGRSSTGATPFVAPSHFVRVDLGRLDELMRIMGDMVVHRARLEEALGRVSRALPSNDSRELQEITHGFSRELRRLRDGLCAWCRSARSLNGSPSSYETFHAKARKRSCST
jgi:two-component system chemotaxis sensor kinase CheA